MVYHASLYGLAPRDNSLVAFGWMGVDLFFVLSGFLIGGQLFRPFAVGESPDYLLFFKRRLLRTIPAFAVVLAVYFLLPGWREQVFIQPFWQFVTFTQNLFIHAGKPIAFSHAWSLCVEEQFYLLFPLAVMLGSRAWRHKPGVARFAVAVSGVLLFGILLREYHWLHDVAQTPFDIHSEPDWRAYMSTIYYSTWTRLDGLLAGVSLAAMRTLRPQWWKYWTARPNLLLFAGVAGVVASAWFFGEQIASFWPAAFGYPMLAFSIALIVAAGAEARSLLGRVRIPGASALAAGAYSLYLTHKLVLRLVQTSLEAAGVNGMPVAIAAFAAAFAVGAVLYIAVERPFLRLRDRTASAKIFPSLFRDPI